jgi:hypothetical protein
MVVVWEVDPLVPVMVTVRLPVEARRPMVMVMVDVPAPLMDVGLKVTVLPLPCPEADNEIAELKPPVTEVETVT